MPQKVLEQHTETLVAVFYREGTESHREELAREEAAAQQALREASGLEDDALLGRLASLGIRAETLAALTLIPLIEVAWADGVMEEKERKAILAGAESTGIEPGSPSYGLLSIWTEERPPADLSLAWRDYIAALGPQLDAEQREKLRDKVVGRARSVAEAAGGFLGIGSISREEAEALDQLDGAFGA